MYACKLACKRVQMGANGGGWVRMGALRHISHKQHKNKAGGGNFWSSRTGFGSYGRGNFPGHDVWWILSKMINNGFEWVILHKDGCYGAYCRGGRRKNKKKRVQNAQASMFWDP